MVTSLLKPAPLTLALFLSLAVPAALLDQPGNRLAEMLGVLAVTLPGALLVIGGHELGHVVGGLLSGHRFVALVFGPFAVSRVGARLKLEWNRVWWFYGGLAMLTPRSGRLPPIRESVAVYAAGPLASLLLGGLFVALHFGLGLDGVTRRTIAAGTHTSGDLLLGAITLMMGCSSLLIAVATMIPNAVGGFTSDGAAIRVLLTGGPEAERLQAMHAVMGQLSEGTRPRDWSPEFIRRAAGVQDGSAMESGAASFGLQHALDRGDLAAARAHLRRLQVASAKAPAISQGELRLAEAWLAVADGRPSEARTAFAQTEETLVEAFSRRRVLAAILVAEGRADEGMAAAREGLALMLQADQVFPGAAAMEREWLEQLAEGQLPAVLTLTRAPA
jgi:hypothetical protein